MFKKIKKKNVRVINILLCVDCVKEVIVCVFFYYVVIFCFVGIVDNIL